MNFWLESPASTPAFFSTTAPYISRVFSLMMIPPCLHRHTHTHTHSGRERDTNIWKKIRTKSIFNVCKFSLNSYNVILSVSFSFSFSILFRMHVCMYVCRYVSAPCIHAMRICIFKKCLENGPQNFIYFFIKKFSIRWFACLLHEIQCFWMLCKNLMPPKTSRIL